MLDKGVERAGETTDSGSRLAPTYPVEEQTKLNKRLLMTAFGLHSIWHAL